MSTVVAPLEVHRYPDGHPDNMPFLVSVLCPFCEDVHTHAVSVRAVGEGFTWECASSLLRRGRYRLAVLPTLGAMWDLLSPPDPITTERTTP